MNMFLNLPVQFHTKSHKQKLRGNDMKIINVKEKNGEVFNERNNAVESLTNG